VLELQDRGWLASAIDCESGAGIHSQGRRAEPVPRINIQMMSRDFVKRLKDVTGLVYFGPVSFRTRDGKRAVKFQWSVKNRQALAIIRAVYDLLIVKKAEADEILEYYGEVKREP